MDNALETEEKVLNIDMEAEINSKFLERLQEENEELKRQNKQLEALNEDLNRKSCENDYFFHHAPVGCVHMDESGVILKANLQAQSIFGNERLIGCRLEEQVTENSKEGWRYFVSKINKGFEICEAELEIGKDSDVRYVKVIGSCNSDELAHSTTVLIIHDETVELEYRKKVEYLSFHDQLTGLYNRRFFEVELKRLDVERSYPMGIILADLNGLKLVNDAFGHGLGDALLVETSKRLKNELRQEDIVARLGGDEFVVLLPKTPEEKLKEIASRIKRGCEEMEFGDMNLSISLGYCLKVHKEQSIHTVLKIAEERMYKDKLFRQTSQRKEIINGILITLHGKSQREAEHAKRVSILCAKMARALGMDEVTTGKMKTAGLFHDIGKIAVDNDILYKSGRFSTKEHRKYQKHTEIGYRILRQSEDFAEVAEIALSHHERIDGSGYPRGLKGDEISLESKILTICDAFDAMVSARPYRNTKTKAEAINELKKNAGTQFDPRLVDVFIHNVVEDLPTISDYKAQMNDSSIWDE